MSDTDPRPPVAFGHVGPHLVPDIDEGTTFYESLGLRTVARPDGMAIMEVRGGTHLILREGTPNTDRAPFDLMVDDIDAAHASYAEAGHDVSDIGRGHIHDNFTLVDPAGATVTVNSSHAMGSV
ncbi:MAG: VOC family protein [Actinomycetota bacterium]